MNYVDILVLASVLLAIGLIILMMVKEHKKGQCASCPLPKKAKRMIKDYRKEQEKEDKKPSSK